MQSEKPMSKAQKAEHDALATMRELEHIARESDIPVKNLDEHYKVSGALASQRELTEDSQSGKLSPIDLSEVRRIGAESSEATRVVEQATRQKLQDGVLTQEEYEQIANTLARSRWVSGCFGVNGDSPIHVADTDSPPHDAGVDKSQESVRAPSGEASDVGDTPISDDQTRDVVAEGSDQDDDEAEGDADTFDEDALSPISRSTRSWSDSEVPAGNERRGTARPKSSFIPPSTIIEFTHNTLQKIKRRTLQRRQQRHRTVQPHDGTNTTLGSVFNTDNAHHSINSFCEVSRTFVATHLLRRCVSALCCSAD